MSGCTKPFARSIRGTVAVFQSGGQDLYEQPHQLLLYNRTRAAELEVKQQGAVMEYCLQQEDFIKSNLIEGGKPVSELEGKVVVSKMEITASHSTTEGE